jgi:mannose-1-phosphate guanylyltransferase
MKGLILAAGLGTRLGQLTQETPKALIRVGDKPILDHNIRKILEIGITEVLINTHYLAEQVQNFLETQNYPASITTIFEPELLGTAGTLKANLDFFGDRDLLVMHGDNYFTSGLNSLVNAHFKRSTKTEMTMATFMTDNPELCGTVLIDNAGVVTDFFEKKKDSNSNEANSAIYIFSEQAKLEISHLASNETDISNHLIPKMLTRIQAHRLHGEFIDIGSPLGLRKANDAWLNHSQYFRN